ncbi:MAG: ATP-binding cassette domain-containing protein [Candidatus Cloacimonetes bacterium]|nr:ATP-binding cassette domain-containing protein [Candidatus Cloacimonadota bacterium]
MIETGVSRLAKRFSSEPVLTEITFDIQTGEKLGIVGSNGTGKTTIFRIITGQETADAGNITLRKGSTIGYLCQEPDEYQDINVQQVILLAFKELQQQARQLRKLEEQFSDNEKDINCLTREYGDLQAAFEHNGGYAMEVEMAKICSGLQIGEQMRQQRFHLLSGGEKTRVMLAKILLEKPDVLLLDEPTNHLDISASEWLEDFITNYAGAALIISHDRYFLDKTVSGIIEIEAGRSVRYSGNYSDYVKEKERRFLADFENYRNIQKKIKAMKAAAERYRIWGRINPDNSAHFAHAKRLEAKIEELEQIEKPTEKNKISMEFNSGRRSGNDVIIAENVSKRYGDKVLFRKTGFLLKYKERLAFIGANGSGKSTFFRLVLQQESPDNGRITLGASIQTGYMEQEIEFADRDASVIDTFRNEFPMTEGEARNILAKFLFRRDDVFKKVSSLSGGEKVRLRICGLMQQDLNLLLLDEPTNHLDIESREMIEEALQDFQGSIFFISHDRYFINKIATSIVALENNNLQRYPGNYEYYREKSRMQENITQPASGKKSKPGNSSRPNPIMVNKVEAEISDIEDFLNKLAKEKDIYATDYQKLLELQKEEELYRDKLEILLGQWEKLLENN